MTHIKRSMTAKLTGHAPSKAVVVFGARGIGKKTMIKEAVGLVRNVRWYDGDNSEDVGGLALKSAGDVRAVLSQGETIVITEAQRVPSIGLVLKRLVDMNKTLEHPVRILVTASASLDLASGGQESAVGRLVNLQMWPLSLGEMANRYGWDFVRQNLNRCLVYGMRPDVCLADEALAQKILQNHAEGAMYRDVAALSGIRRMDRMQRLVRILALRIGQVISYDALGRETGLNKTTVAEYVNVLEQCGIVRVCRSYFRDLPTEHRKGKKIYFCDNGIRNAVIGRFEPFAARDDAAALWENFFFMERAKIEHRAIPARKIYFWRTSGRKPNMLDFVEIEGGNMQAFECRISENEPAKPRRQFEKAYPQCRITTVTPDNVMEIFGGSWD